MTSRPISSSPHRPLVSLWLPVIAWCGLIYYLSDIPHLRITQQWWDIILRKIAHMLEYAVLARLLVRALGQSTSWPRKKVLLWSFALSVLYACSDEFHQNFVEGRVGSALDVVIDTLGAAIGLVLL